MRDKHEVVRTVFERTFDGDGTGETFTTTYIHKKENVPDEIWDKIKGGKPLEYLTWADVIV